MAETTEDETNAEDRESLAEVLRACIDLNRKVLEEQVEVWKDVGDRLRHGDYGMESAVQDGRDGAQRAVNYCTDMLDVTIRCATAFTGSFGGPTEKK